MQGRIEKGAIFAVLRLALYTRVRNHSQQSKTEPIRKSILDGADQLNISFKSLMP